MGYCQGSLIWDVDQIERGNVPVPCSGRLNHTLEEYRPNYRTERALTLLLDHPHLGPVDHPKSPTDLKTQEGREVPDQPVGCNFGQRPTNRVATWLPSSCCSAGNVVDDEPRWGTLDLLWMVYDVDPVCTLLFFLNRPGSVCRMHLLDQYPGNIIFLFLVSSINPQAPVRQLR